MTLPDFLADIREPPPIDLSCRHPARPWRRFSQFDGAFVEIRLGGHAYAFGWCNLRALAVTTATRSAALPDVPTVGDFLSGFEASVWLGIGAPKNTPAEIIEKLNREVNAALADPKMKARLAHLGSTVLGGSPSDFGRLIADETEKWGKVIRAANIKAE